MTLSLLERFRRGRGAWPPNRWHQAGDGRGGVHAHLWTCLCWDVERQNSDRWRATYLYRNQKAENEVESRDFPTAEAAMLAVDVWCSEQWC